MKKLFYTTVVMLFMFTVNTNAQEVFNAVMQSAQNALKDPVQNFSKTQMAKFKIDELNYLKSKAGNIETI